nr:hypothetical protein 1 - hepatitis C virus [Hepacivirus hominis]
MNHSPVRNYCLHAESV